MTMRTYQGSPGGSGIKFAVTAVPLALAFRADEPPRYRCGGILPTIGWNRSTGRGSVSIFTRRGSTPLGD